MGFPELIKALFLNYGEAKQKIKRIKNWLKSQFFISIN